MGPWEGVYSLPYEQRGEPRESLKSESHIIKFDPPVVWREKRLGSRRPECCHG